MNIKIILLVCWFFLLSIAPSTAYVSPPDFGPILNLKDRSALSALCEFNDNTKNSIKCYFTQTSLVLDFRSEAFNDPSIDYLKSYYKNNPKVSFNILCNVIKDALLNAIGTGLYADSIETKLLRICSESNPDNGLTELLKLAQDGAKDLQDGGDKLVARIQT